MYRSNTSTRQVLGACLILGAAALLFPTGGIAQIRFGAADERADQALSERATTESSAGSETAAEEAEFTMPLLELLWKGGWLMIPIAAMSLIVVAVGLERMIALRRGQIFPRRLQYELEGYVVRNNFDPLHANQLCHRYPSTAATVLRAMPRLATNWSKRRTPRIASLMIRALHESLRSSPVFASEHSRNARDFLAMTPSLVSFELQSTVCWSKLQLKTD